MFTRTPGPVDLRHLSQWWTWTPGACWRHPDGPGSSLEGREDHPVVHVAYEDAQAYAAWDGKELPTEAEWELAARGGLEGATYTWGEKPETAGQRLANYWHGDFPWRSEEGYGATTAVGLFPPNGYGLSDMAGNVWEWTSDWYLDRHQEDADKPCCVPANPKGGVIDQSYDPASAAVSHPPQGDQGRVSPMRRQLLHALQTRCPTTTHDRHRNEPHRLPLRPTTVTTNPPGLGTTETASINHALSTT